VVGSHERSSESSGSIKGEFVGQLNDVSDS
jgi:hypothetical protein